MEQLTDNFWMIITIIIVLSVIVLQLYFFSLTRKNIKELASFFPNLEKLYKIHRFIPKEILDSKEALKKFITKPYGGQSHTENGVSKSVTDTVEVANKERVYVEVIRCSEKINANFQDVLDETNSFLCKNVGSSAEFSVLQDICERKIESLEEQIQNTINTPLYLGLAGTFIGIIVGVGGIVPNIQTLFSGLEEASSPLSLKYSLESDRHECYFLN